MLATQFRLSSPFKSKAGGGNSSAAPAHVFFYRLTEHLEICVDGRTFGNDARFCRRSRAPNAELRHVLDKGSLHLFIVAVKTVEKNSEILLPLEAHGTSVLSSEPLQSINADLREINKKPVNGVVNNSSGEELPPKEKSVKKKEKKKVKKSLGAKEKPQTPAKIKPKKSAASSKITPDDVDDEDSLPASEGEINGENDSNNVPSSPSKGKPSPGKLGLPDNSGLIVGVNTINYDASSSVKNKAKVKFKS